MGSNEIDILVDVADSFKPLVTDNDPITAKRNNVSEWKEFYDNQVVPLRLEQYIMHATLLNEQQDLYSKNTTLVDNQTVQLSMVDRILSDFNNKGYGSMREFQSIDYNINLKNLHIQYIKYTTLLAAVIFLMTGLTMIGIFDPNLTILIGSILIIVYVFILLLNFKQNQVRRKYSWNNIYWKSPNSDDKSSKNQCKFLGVF